MTMETQEKGNLKKKEKSIVELYSYLYFQLVEFMNTVKAWVNMGKYYQNRRGKYTESCPLNTINIITAASMMVVGCSETSPANSND